MRIARAALDAVGNGAHDAATVGDYLIDRTGIGVLEQHLTRFAERAEALKCQKALASLPALFVVLVGPARIYLGVHWASDVLGAYLFGGSWLALSLRLYLALRNRKMLTQQEQQRSK